MVTNVALPVVESKDLKLYLEDFRNILPLKNIQTVIVDPPYNINFNYGKNYKDNIDPEEWTGTFLASKSAFEGASFRLLSPKMCR